MNEKVPLERWGDKPVDDYIGIRYRVVFSENGKRTVAKAGLRGLSIARYCTVDVAGGFLTRLAEAGALPTVNDGCEVPVAVLDDGMGLRVQLPEGPVDFIIEEDTCEGDPDCDDPENDNALYA